METQEMNKPSQGHLRDGGANDPLSPPALPVKQRRSLYSLSSSPGSSFDLDSGNTFLPQDQTSSLSDESFAAADCQAAQCPIHHLSGLSCNRSSRFLSDTTPPPLPKKCLTRAFSLPGGSLSPLYLLPFSWQNYDNPIYMMNPVKNLQIHAETEDTATFEKPVPLNMNLLDFATPDSQLPSYFRNFGSQVEVSLGIQERHLLFLTSVVRRLETSYLKEVSAQRVESLQLKDFVLCKNHTSRHIDDALFYPVVCSKFPACVFAAKVWNPSTEDARVTRLAMRPPHVNIEEILLHLSQYPKLDREQQLKYIRPNRQGNKQEDSATESVLLSDQQASKFSHESSAELDRNRRDCPDSENRTVLSLVSEDCEVDIVRELPRGTLDDFVQDGAWFHRAQPEVYEKRLGLLLLQVTQGLQHLHSQGAPYTQLCPQSILLAWPETAERGQGGGDHVTESTHMLWSKWGAPQVVLTVSKSRPEANRAGPSVELQLGHLLRRCLHVSENQPPPATGGVVQETPGSTFSRCLLQLAASLEEGELQVADAVGLLQVLLWGPEVLQQNPVDQFPLHNWLSVKRSLLILKLAERGLSTDCCALNWEDYLCLQYHCLTAPNTILKALKYWDSQALHTSSKAKLA